MFDITSQILYNRTMNKYQYQDTATKELIRMLSSEIYIATVLAACPSSGKSTIAVKVINEFLSKNNSKVLIVTHNQNILRDQMIENFTSPNVPVNFTFEGDNAQVIVSTMASVKKINNLQEIGLLIIDEAHEYYLEKSYSNLKNLLSKNCKELLMTGSPAFFNAYNKNHIKGYGIYHISAEELMDFDVFASVDLDIAVTEHKTPRKVIEDVMKYAKEKGYNLSKPMVAVKTIEEACMYRIVFTDLGYSVALSTSQNDKDNDEIKRFKSGEKNLLIVVSKGILGFSESSITALIDLKNSSDIDVRNQLFARVLRKKEGLGKKAYISVCSPSKVKKELNMLNRLLGITDREVFRNYTGKY